MDSCCFSVMKFHIARSQTARAMTCYCPFNVLAYLTCQLYIFSSFDSMKALCEKYNRMVSNYVVSTNLEHFLFPKMSSL
jgi:hypothetical protein